MHFWLTQYTLASGTVAVSILAGCLGVSDPDIQAAASLPTSAQEPRLEMLPEGYNNDQPLPASSSMLEQSLASYMTKVPACMRAADQR